MNGTSPSTAHDRQPPRALAGRLGACSWSLRPTGPRELAQDLQRLGLHACQLALVPLAVEPSKWDAAPSILRDAGIEPVSGMLAMIGEDYSTLESIRRTGGVTPDEHWPANLERATAVADIAAAAAIPLVTFHAGFLPQDRRDPARSRIAQRIGAILGEFAKRGVAIALETGQESAATLRDFLAETGLADVGLNFDPANMILYGMGDPVEAVRLLAPRVVQMHIKDAVPAGRAGEWGRETPVGEGAVDWSAFFEIVTSIGRPLDLIIEREAGPNRMTDIAAARDLILRRLANSDESQPK